MVVLIVFSIIKSFPIQTGKSVFYGYDLHKSISFDSGQRSEAKEINRFFIIYKMSNTGHAL